MQAFEFPAKRFQHPSSPPHPNSSFVMPLWSDLVADKRKRQQELIPKEWLITSPPDSVLNVTSYPEKCGLLTTHELEITNATIDVLLPKLASGQWSAVAVTTAFSKRAIIAHQLVNCLTEIFIDRALVRAAELDEHLKKTGTPVGPLHGLPISLKDQLSIEGLETVMGYASWVGKYADKNAVLVDILLEAGAVLYVRTNVPQTLMFPETCNHVFGRTTNPYNRSLTSGGSSGGEGALIALKGSPLGVGSDIGGSVRIPSALCGLYGLRPSYGRIPYSGALNSLEGQDSLPSVLGPITTSLAGLKAFTKAVVELKPWFKDPLAARKKWDEDEYELADHGRGKGLCFAIMWHDGTVVPHPPITRSLELVKAALLKAGHKVINWKPLKHKELCDAARGMWHSASFEDFTVVTTPSSEPLFTSMRPPTLPPVESCPAHQPGISSYKLWQIQKGRRDMRKEYMDMWEATVGETGTGRPVDAIIGPAAPYAAPPHGLNTYTAYTTVWNALDYTASIFPVSAVDTAIDAKQPRKTFLNDTDKVYYEMYEPETFKDAPISLQLIGRTLEEEAVIAMTEIVSNALDAVKSQIASKL